LFDPVQSTLVFEHDLSKTFTTFGNHALAEQGKHDQARPLIGGGKAAPARACIRRASTASGPGPAGPQHAREEPAHFEVMEE